MFYGIILQGNKTCRILSNTLVNINIFLVQNILKSSFKCFKSIKLHLLIYLCLLKTIHWLLTGFWLSKSLLTFCSHFLPLTPVPLFLSSSPPDIDFPCPHLTLAQLHLGKSHPSCKVCKCWNLPPIAPLQYALFSCSGIEYHSFLFKYWSFVTALPPTMVISVIALAARFRIWVSQNPALILDIPYKRRLNVWYLLGAA